MYIINPNFSIARLLRKGTSGKRRMHRRRSFTLIEVLISFVVTAVIIVAAVGLLKTTIWAGSLFSHRAAAQNIANSRIERLRTVPYADIETMAETDTPVDEEGMLDSDGDYLRTTEIGNDYMKTRTVTVTVGGEWKYDQPPVEVSVTSIIADDSIMR